MTESFDKVSFYIVVILTISFGFSSNAFILPVENQENKDVSTNALFLVGTVDGKTYYREDDAVRMDWFESKAHCNASGLQLATVTTGLQLEFLKNAHSNGLLPGRGWYWCAGRETRDYRMFSWDISESEIPSIFTGKPFSQLDQEEYYVCLHYYAPSGTLQMQECTYNQANVLCETI